MECVLISSITWGKHGVRTDGKKMAKKKNSVRLGDTLGKILSEDKRAKHQKGGCADQSYPKYTH